MYMTFRQMRGDLSRMPDAIELVTRARDRLNGEHGARYAVSINVGGDPAAVSLSSPWNDLGDYERVRNEIVVDAELQSIIRTSAGILSDATDTIGQVLKAPSGRGAYAVVNTANMLMPAVADAVPFALEVATYVDSQVDGDMGVVAAMTGNRSGIMWLRYVDSLNQAAEEGERLETDQGYLSFFKRSETLFVPGTLEQSIWQIMP
jgi:hypothetical protein